MESPFANLYNALLDRIKATVPEVEWIDGDDGQLEGYAPGYRPTVKFPCVLLDFDDWEFEDVANNIQIGTGIVVVRLAQQPYSNSSKATPQPVREKALKNYDIAQVLYKKLHGWSDGTFSTLRRKSQRNEKRNDDIRVKIIRFSCSFKDYSAQPDRTKVPRPDPVIGTDIKQPS